MIFKACPREKELTELMRSGHWPEASDEELRAHAKGCRRCSDLALVTRAFQESRARAVGEVSLDAPKMTSPGLLWWRAQLRRRNAAVERVGKPILRAQGFALAVNGLVALGLVIVQWRSVAEWLGSFSGMTGTAWIARGKMLFTAAAGSLTAAGHGWNWMAVVPGLAGLALLGGVAVYFATDKQ